MRTLWSLLPMLLIFCGCAGLQDHCFRAANRSRARHAWKSVDPRRQAFASVDYRSGWIDGYYEVLTGGNPVPPAVPPREYWHPAYQDPEGQAAINDWFAGYQDGALRATRSSIRSDLPVWASPVEPAAYVVPHPAVVPHSPMPVESPTAVWTEVQQAPQPQLPSHPQLTVPVEQTVAPQPHEPHWVPARHNAPPPIGAAEEPAPTRTANPAQRADVHFEHVLNSLTAELSQDADNPAKNAGRAGPVLVK